jgi:integrase
MWIASRRSSCARTASASSWKSSPRGGTLASVWIRTRTTASGKRYRVEYQPGGREAKIRYGGSFKTRREALARKAYIAGELAALRMPDLRFKAEAPARTLAEAARRWQASRIDAAANTKIQHHSALNRALPILGRRRVDELAAQDFADMVAQLHTDGLSRESIRKTRTALAMVLDHEHVTPNPARDPSVRLPREEREEPQPPSAEHVETVFRLVPSKHRLALLWLDWSGARVGSVDHVRVGDYDEPHRRVRLRRSWTKTRRGLWVELPDVLAEAIEATLPPREDRVLDARLFADSGADALRTSIAKACKAAGIPLWSPHDLRHRRISLLHRQGRSWAEIGELVGQRSLKVTADTYTHVLVDEAELDYAMLLNRAG